MKERENQQIGPFECVEPELGDQRALLDDPDLDSGLRRRLMDHLTICDACRLERDIVRRADRELASGRLVPSASGPGAASATPRGRRLSRGLAWGGGLAAAASLALVFLVPPRPAGPETTRRSDADTPRFVRPVEGEVLLSATPELEWSVVEGATAYRLQISEVEGDELWSARIESNQARVPADMSLSRSSRYRAVVEPVPADLGGLADVNVTFRRSGLPVFLVYRLAAAPAPVRWLGALASIVGAIGLAGLFVRDRRTSI